MKKLKIVFFGSPEFAKTSLEEIYNSQHSVVGVVTVADKQSGRGQKINSSPVKEFAIEHNLPIFQPLKLKDETFIESMKNLEADIFVVVAFRMMPKVLFDLPAMGTFNLHASLLPNYRGAAPINYALINGETKTGATTFFINEKIDEGNILLQDELSISEQENAGELHDRLMLLGGKLVVKTLDGLANNTITEKSQINTDVVKSAHKIFKEDTKIYWNQTGRDIHNFIRGMSPYPAAFTRIKINEDIKVLKIFAGTFQEQAVTNQLKISKNEFLIPTQDGYFMPSEVQLEGKKRMQVKDFLNGFRDFSNISIVHD